MPPTAIGKGARGARGATGGKKGKGKQSNRLPAGRKDCIATHAAACLRFLALCPNFLPELIGRGGQVCVRRECVSGVRG